MPPLVCSQFSPALLEQLQRFRLEKYLCDCRLVVESPGEEATQLEFSAHRLVLAAGSPFFRDLFLLKSAEMVTTVNLNNCPPDCLEVVLQFLYSGQLHLRDCDPQQVLTVARVCKIAALEQMLSSLTTPKLDPQPHICASPSSKRRAPETPTESPHTPASLLKKLCNKHLLLGCNYCCSPAEKDNASEVSLPYEPAAQHLNFDTQTSAALSMLSQTSAWHNFAPILPKNMLPLHLAALGPQIPLVPFASPTTLLSPTVSNETPSKASKPRAMSAKMASPAYESRSDKDETLIPSSDKEGWCRNKKYIQRVPSGFMCTVCHKVYGRYNSVSYHVTIYHRNPPIKCDEPGCQFTTREARYIHFHKYYRHGIALPDTIDLRPRSCPFCRHVAKSPAMLEKHINRHMPDCVRTGKDYKCPQCAKEFTSQQSMAEHILTHTDEKIQQCDECSYKGRTASNLRQHKLFKHSSDMFKQKFKCEQCGYSTPTEGNLTAHMRRVHKVHIPAKNDTLAVEDVIVLTENGNDSASPSSSDGERPIEVDSDTPQPPPYPEQISELPPPPPPSYCSSVLTRQSSAESGTSVELMGEQSDTSLDDSHSDLATASTGYHSMVNYGAV